MLNDKSTFRYKILDNLKPPKAIVEKINEELNRGLAFIISQTADRTINIAGKWKGWISTATRGKNIYIDVDDSMFILSCVIEQILTSLWMNLLDFGEIQLEEFQLSNNIHALITSGNTGKPSIQKLLRINGPYFGIVLKPSFSLSLSEKLHTAEKFANLGGVFIKEDETYLVEKSKLLRESEIIQKVMNEVSDHCFYVPNITPYLIDDRLFQELYGIGIRVVMIDYLITGFPTVYKVLNKNKNLLFWGHRIGYKSIERYISMKAVALLAAYSGMNMIHIGTPFFSVNNIVKERLSILEALNKVNPEVIPIFTKSSPQEAFNLKRLFGKNIIIMACGSIRTNGYLDWNKVKELVQMVQK